MNTGANAGAGVRLLVDPPRCDGHGICALICPELISLDEWGFPVVDQYAIDTRSLTRAAKRAVRACPARALSLSAPIRIVTKDSRR